MFEKIKISIDLIIFISLNYNYKKIDDIIIDESENFENLGNDINNTILNKNLYFLSDFDLIQILNENFFEIFEAIWKKFPFKLKYFLRKSFF